MDGGVGQENGSIILDESIVSKLQNVIVGRSVQSDDLQRWFSQGFCFSDFPPLYGLTQSHGGPCGVISVVQAEIFREVFFGVDKLGGSACNAESLPVLSPQQCKEVFETATWRVLQRASTCGAVYLVDPGDKDICKFSDCTQLSATRCLDERQYKQTLRKNMSEYGGKAGCFLFLLSLVLTRGAQTVKEDMDDMETTLVGSFGHCTQELMNLLLVGQATSNVFDGSMPFDDSSASSNDSIMLKGTPARSAVGYLTQLEALRYCQVGSYYKIPVYPIWVLGSTSHFSVLFATDRRVNEESDDEALLTKVQRVFKSVDTDECGFIMDNRLKEVLENLSVVEAGDAAWLERLSNHMQMEGGGGIILWSNFWETISLLLTGSSLDSILSSDGSEINATAPRRDSDVARSLQQEENVGGSRPRSDSELARQLQDEWNANDDAVPSLEGDRVPSPMKKATRHRSDSIADVNADVFVLYHYNGFSGMSGGQANKKLTRLTMYRRSQESSIGQSIAFSGGSAFSGGTAPPIEEVLRTRWQGCRLEWLGSEPKLD